MGCCSSAKAVQVSPFAITPVLPDDDAAANSAAPARGPGKKEDAAPTGAAFSPATPEAAEPPREQDFQAPAPQAKEIQAPAPQAKVTVDIPPPQVRPKRPKSLIKAVKDNDVPAVDELLRSGCGLEDLGMWDNTPLLVACTYGHREIALKLIAQRANIAAKNENAGTPLHYAAVEGLTGVVDALIEAARSQGSEKDVAALVNCGFAKIYNRHLDSYVLRAPLAAAAESGFQVAVESLLEAGAAVDAAGEDGRTALWAASRQSKTPVVKALLRRSANVNAKDATGVSVLEAATASCGEDTVLALLNHGVADVNDTAGSALRDAVRAGRRSVVEALLTQGASVHPKPGPGGAMPLHVACEKGDEHLVSLLVRNRADPEIKDVSGRKAFDLLRKRGLPDAHILNLLSPPSERAGDGGTGGGGLDEPIDMF